MRTVRIIAPAAAQAPRFFTEWCDTTTAQGTISLAANRMFGYISTLSDEQWKARTAWTNEAYKMAAARFKAITGRELRQVLR